MVADTVGRFFDVPVQDAEVDRFGLWWIVAFSFATSVSLLFMTARWPLDVAGEAIPWWGNQTVTGPEVPKMWDCPLADAQ